MRHNRRVRVFALAALAAAILLFAWRLLPNGDSLLQAATLRYRLHGKEFVAWLSSSEALVVQYNRPGGNYTPTVSHPYMLDTRTGGSSPLTELDGLWGKEQINGVEMYSASGLLSRDGKSLLLWSGFARSRANGGIARGPRSFGRFYVMDARAKSVQLLRIGSPFTWTHWGPDSKTVVAFGPGRPAQSRPIPLLPQLTIRSFAVSPTASPGPSFPFTQKHSLEWPVGYTADGRLLSSLNRALSDSDSVATGGRTQYPRDVSLTSYTGGADIKEKTRSSAPFPPGFWLHGNPILSQAGERLLWHASPIASPDTPIWMRKIKRALGIISSAQRLSLWSSDLEGGSMQEIGAVTMPGPSHYYPGVRACWLPAGQRISFVYHDTLFVVAAKRPALQHTINRPQKARVETKIHRTIRTQI